MVFIKDISLRNIDVFLMEYSSMMAKVTKIHEPFASSKGFFQLHYIFFHIFLKLFFKAVGGTLGQFASKIARRYSNLVGKIVTKLFI